MKTLQRFAAHVPDIPTVAAWSLTELAEMKGHQDLFTRQSPEKLKALREHAIIESAVSSNRIEGVVIDQDRAKAVILGKGRLRDRNEEEVRDYQKALNWIHERAQRIPVSIATVCRLHETCRGEMWDSGKLKGNRSRGIGAHGIGWCKCFCLGVSDRVNRHVRCRMRVS